MKNAYRQPGITEILCSGQAQLQKNNPELDILQLKKIPKKRQTDKDINDLCMLWE